MSEKLTAVQAKALRFMVGVRDGMVTVEDPEIARALDGLIHTPFAAIAITAAGRRALADYDAERSDKAVRARIAAGMSKAGGIHA